MRHRPPRVESLGQAAPLGTVARPPDDPLDHRVPAAQRAPIHAPRQAFVTTPSARTTLAAAHEDARRLWSAQAPVVAERLAQEGLMPLFSVLWPAQGLYAESAVESVDGLARLGFHVYDAPLEAFAQAAGASPARIEAPDIPHAFATGQVEAMTTSPSTGANSAAWDCVNRCTRMNAWLPKDVVVVSRRAFDALDEEIRQAVIEAAEAQTEVLTENGMTVAEPSDALTTGLREIEAEMSASLDIDTSEAAAVVLEAHENQ